VRPLPLIVRPLKAPCATRARRGPDQALRPRAFAYSSEPVGEDARNDDGDEHQQPLLPAGGVHHISQEPQRSIVENSEVDHHRELEQLDRPGSAFGARAPRSPTKARFMRIMSVPIDTRLLDSPAVEKRSRTIRSGRRVPSRSRCKRQVVRLILTPSRQRAPHLYPPSLPAPRRAQYLRVRRSARSGCLLV